MKQAAPAPSSPPTIPDAGSAVRTAEALADGLNHMLHVAVALLNQRRRVDLTGLDERIGRLCAAVLDLPPEQGCDLRPKLLVLRDQIDRLGARATSAHFEPDDPKPV